MKIPGYTLHGDYYLANNLILGTTWKQACEIKQEITLPNGKIVVAHTLSKEELETIPKKERAMKDYWYWTKTPDGDDGIYEWVVDYNGSFSLNIINNSNDYGGVRLGFHKNEIKQFLDIE